jgi:hypothetical protein
MKIVILMFLEGDGPTVERLLSEAGVTAYSNVAVEGHGGGQAGGWYGQAVPFRSRTVFAMVDELKAKGLLEAVENTNDTEDPRHPIHAVQVCVDQAVQSGENLPSQA